MGNLPLRVTHRLCQASLSLFSHPRTSASGLCFDPAKQLKPQRARDGRQAQWTPLWHPSQARSSSERRKISLLFMDWSGLCCVHTFYVHAYANIKVIIIIYSTYCSDGLQVDLRKHSCFYLAHHQTRTWHGLNSLMPILNAPPSSYDFYIINTHSILGNMTVMSKNHKEQCS